MRLSRIPAATKTANPARRAGFRGGSGAGSGSGEGWRSIESTRGGGEAARLVCHVRGTGRRRPRNDERPGATARSPRGGGLLDERRLERYAARDLDDPAGQAGRRPSERRVGEGAGRVVEVHDVEEVVSLETR